MVNKRTTANTQTRASAAVVQLLEARPDLLNRIESMLRAEKVDDSSIYVDIGHKVKVQREKLGISQGDLASVTGLTRTSITNLEAGRQRTPIHVLCKIAGALNVKVSALLP